jgi:hypothetical protein
VTEKEHTKENKYNSANEREEETQKLRAAHIRERR